MNEYILALFSDINYFKSSLSFVLVIVENSYAYTRYKVIVTVYDSVPIMKFIISESTVFLTFSSRRWALLRTLLTDPESIMKNRLKRPLRILNLARSDYSSCELYNKLLEMRFCTTVSIKYHRMRTSHSPPSDRFLDVLYISLGGKALNLIRRTCCQALGRQVCLTKVIKPKNTHHSQKELYILVTSSSSLNALDIVSACKDFYKNWRAMPCFQACYSSKFATILKFFSPLFCLRKNDVK